jgi:T4-like virus Myoviridae tail sheath stabiliser
MADFFYDHQVRRFVSQFVRAFSQFYVEYGKDQDGNTTLYRVPVRYADTNRQVSSIMHNNSENTLTTVPIMVCYIDGLKYDRDRIQNPTHVETINIRERAKDNSGNLTTKQRQGFSIDRLMPAPYKLTMKMEVWTTNFDQKLQILEQICTIFNPALEIQSTDNFVDWTSLSYILLQDIVWTTRNIPIGTDDPIDIASLTFDLPIWISAPAKLKKLGVIQTIVASVYDSNGNLSQAIQDESILTANRQYFTPLGYNVIVVNGEVRLVKKYGPVAGLGDNLTVPNTLGTAINWDPLLTLIGTIKNGISLLQLRDATTGNVVVGTISTNPIDPTILLFNVDQDTIPNNNLPAINSIIDPRKSAPGAGLPAPVTGVRYMILNSIGDKNTAIANQAAAWKNHDGTTTFAKANDIIGWDGNRWDVLFDSQNAKTNQYVTNTYTGVQYKWTGTEWVKSWEGYYDEGYWTIVI